jgi:hypothetical protein
LPYFLPSQRNVLSPFLAKSKVMSGEWNGLEFRKFGYTHQRGKNCN